MRVVSIDPGSPLFGKVRKQFRLLRINGETVKDNLDCRFKLAEDIVRLEFKDNSGNTVSYQVHNDSCGDLGLEFEPDKMKVCKNRCIFCFVHQQPKGMRRALYIRDDDYRFSFTDGNFISLSNLSKADLKRIAAQRLSPLYVSVHTTDDFLRRKMFGKKKLSPILPQLKYLTDRGITIHTQVVLCPGINDGIHLIKTIGDLTRFYPRIASLGVVPVGLTKYRKNLPKLKTYIKSGAIEIINLVDDYQRKLLSRHDSRFIYAADEFYILAGREFPKLFEYEEMPQFENGVGMMRYFLTDFNRKKRFLKAENIKKRMAVITGISAYSILKDKVITYLKNETGLKIDIYPVKNRFWGRNITVSGLLTGRDILSCLKKMKKEYDIIFLPPNCLNIDNLFLDDISLNELKRKVGLSVRVGSYSMVDTIREAVH
ncbi:MAG: hypothetical protein DRP51_02045 [Candidatus Zixiibacteriota bacterium]|nr:MAG: hypothetical protein DRP51_02045 [candidate division Zixibacteria bacterium]